MTAVEQAEVLQLRRILATIDGILHHSITPSAESLAFPLVRAVWDLYQAYDLSQAYQE